MRPTPVQHRPKAAHQLTAQPAATAILLATAPAEGGDPAATLPWEGGTVLGRLLDQLATLGVGDVHVITRAAGEARVSASLEGAALPVRLHLSDDVADDLRTIADVAASGAGPLVLAYGDLVTHREALAGLLADPRVATGILATGGRTGRPYAFRTRSRRGRVISAGSPYHYVHRPTATFLGVLKVSPADRATVAAQDARLAELTAEPSAAFREELEAKAVRWRHALARTVLGTEEAVAADNAPPDAPVPEPTPMDPEILDRVVLPEELQAELGRRLTAAPHDAAALTLVGLVRAGVHVGNSYLRTLFWARPLSRAAVDEAAVQITTYDEDKDLLDSAVKATDGFFTTHFVSPYSKYIARWAARRGLNPNQVTTFSLLIGALAGVAFATGERPGLIAGAILLQLAFTFDCVDGQLARYTRQFSKLGAWLDSIFDRTKEYVVFAGLAIGASRTGDPVWVLAGAALTLQTVRHMSDFSFAASQHQTIAATTPPPLDHVGDGLGRPTDPMAAHVPDPEPDGDGSREPLSARISKGALRGWRRLDRWAGIIWVKRMVAFPIGERFAAISITAALWSPRTTFVVLLAWGGFAAVYTLAGRLLRSFAR
jgi:hypothetical protein